MRKEYICKECGGDGFIIYDNHNGLDLEETCPSCQDGHILLEKHIEALKAHEKESEE